MVRLRNSVKGGSGIVALKLSLPALIGLTLILFGVPLAAQGAWTKAPPVPQACYRSGDTFEADAEKVRTDLEAQIERQQAINRGITERMMSMDPATLQQRMMAAVQKNPAQAQEIMQAMQGPGFQQSQAAPTEADAGESDFRARKARLGADYQAESNKALGPSYARAVEANPQTRDAAWAEYNRLYETVVCPRWFRQQIPELLASYRSYLEKQRIPRQTEGERKPLPMYEMLGVSTREFRPIAEMQGEVDYLRYASDLFVMRPVARSPNTPN
jgi:hypothetical protein